MSSFGGREVVIVEAVRTPVGRGHKEKGYYRELHPSNLLAHAYTELIARSGIDPEIVEDVVAGCVQQFGEQSLNIGRNAWLEAGFPIETPATTIDRQCGSAQQAVNYAAAMIASGVHDVMIGGGVMRCIPPVGGSRTWNSYVAKPPRDRISEMREPEVTRTLVPCTRTPLTMVPFLLKSCSS